MFALSYKPCSLLRLAAGAQRGHAAQGRGVVEAASNVHALRVMAVMAVEVVVTTSVKAAAERHDAPNTASASAAAATVLSPSLRFIFAQIP